jgi:hypothetical protein
VKYCFLALVTIAFAAAQSVTRTTTTDINGRAVDSISVSSDSQQTELSQSINGRQVPLEQTEEKVLQEDGNTKVVQKIIRKYDPNGQLSSTERVLTTQQKLADGGSLTNVVTYRGDINGRMQEAERKSTETHTQGSVTRSETRVERPTINGAFQVAEKRNTVADTSGGKTHQEEDVYRRNDNGDYYQALRQVTDEQKTGDQTVKQSNIYELGVTGSLRLARQEVSATTKRADGSAVTELNLYARSADGRVQEEGAPLQIKEQQIISRDKSGDTVTETLSVRRPSLADPNRLGSLQQLSQTVCKGKCSSDDKP